MQKVKNNHPSRGIAIPHPLRFFSEDGSAMQEAENNYPSRGIAIPHPGQLFSAS
ncbi:hypothetical protein SIN07_08010 [Pediococcus inopinatus]|uniref:Uncharacterized protein n=1 Tax=Pediococcus inopinatus TaxID=114090 RepID=A0ABZ0Q551_9LACO|nr:hypothetical protein [Pediococcus inopinatus]KRN61031.1 hypothetical protein IV83_GL001141 [Pediococcus inopinatus]WPC18195.1 hypothetical protein N6G94_04145 [Pediococcus inopinatus]WPC20416.1 hypothetical protein N6G95_04315 [Pediococcus inopinatus]WPC22120.1 hypothetical protein N6G96_02565 [Pediococcus inopinatus]WPP08945.1 hypothetical protein SIN07_08010 [Pediococcus inopinatus]